MRGVGDREFIDYTNGRVWRRQEPGDLVLTEESARFFFTRDAIKLSDPALGRVVRVRSSG